MSTFVYKPSFDEGDVIALTTILENCAHAQARYLLDKLHRAPAITTSVCDDNALSPLEPSLNLGS